MIVKGKADNIGTVQDINRDGRGFYKLPFTIFSPNYECRNNFDEMSVTLFHDDKETLEAARADLLKYPNKERVFTLCFGIREYNGRYYNDIKVRNIQDANNY